MLTCGLLDDIRDFEASRGSIKVGVVGFGHMGSTLFAQINRVPGMRPAVVASSRPVEVKRYMEAVCGIDEKRVIVTNEPATAAQAISEGIYVITTDFLAPTLMDGLDAIADATGNPEVGAKVGWFCLERGKHLATFNIEADSVVGSLLTAKARECGVVYTGLAGDEPAATMELINFASFLGLPVVAAGKGKNNPLRPFCTPDMFSDLSRNPSAKSMCSFVDGTNTMIEMAAVANAVGFRPDIRGMHGPECRPDQLAQIFVPKSEGGILTHEGVVDYTMGTLAPGVFIVVRADHAVPSSIFRYVYKREGAYLALVRPYHLLSLEAPISIAEAVVRGRGTIGSRSTQRTADVIAIAKRDLLPGESIDGIGGYMVRGVIENYHVAVAEAFAPIGVLEKAVALTTIKKGQPILLSEVKLHESSSAYKLWSRQRGWLTTEHPRETLVEEMLRAPLVVE